MNDQLFRQYIFASDATNAHYQRGYKKGLARFFHGEDFCTAAEHKKFMNYAGYFAEIGRGYRDGFAGIAPDLSADSLLK